MFILHVNLQTKANIDDMALADVYMQACVSVVLEVYRYMYHLEVEELCKDISMRLKFSQQVHTGQGCIPIMI